LHASSHRIEETHFQPVTDLCSGHRTLSFEGMSLRDGKKQDPGRYDTFEPRRVFVRSVDNSAFLNVVFFVVTVNTLLRDDRYSGLLPPSAHFELSWRCQMQKDERDLLEVLKFELKFLEDGGYGRSPSARCRPKLIFEDSPACMNFNSQEQGPCSDCVLMQLVPREFRSAEIPCRHIPFDKSGETLDSLYRYGDQGEIEEVFGDWLRATIRRLEEERNQVAEKPAARHDETMRGTPFYQKQHPKCANPACPTAFHWTGGGKFFRFRPDPVPASESNSTAESPGGIHGVRHYWLCERCSQAFTLVYDDRSGVVLKALWPELPVTEAHSEVSAT